VQAAFVRAPVVEPDDAVIGEHGRDPFDAEFRGFLHDEVHALAARDALHQVYSQPGLGLIFHGFVDQQRHAVFRDPADRCRPFAIVTVVFSTAWLLRQSPCRR
jgi:hypothetical protein